MLDAKILNWMLQGSPNVNDVYRQVDISLLKSIFVPKLASNPFFSKNEIRQEISTVPSKCFKKFSRCQKNGVRKYTCIPQRNMSLKEWISASF